MSLAYVIVCLCISFWVTFGVSAACFSVFDGKSRSDLSFTWWLIPLVVVFLVAAAIAGPFVLPMLRKQPERINPDLV